MDCREHLQKWLEEITPIRVHPEDGSAMQCVRIENQGADNINGVTQCKVIFCTAAHKYQINARLGSGKRSYLGCQASSRLARPGEDHLRGNDLPDGEFTQETWDRIKDAIIRCELVELAEPILADKVQEGPNA